MGIRSFTDNNKHKGTNLSSYQGYKAMLHRKRTKRERIVRSLETAKEEGDNERL